MQGVRAWLEITRLSNLPTVWTNVLTGFIAAWLARLELNERFGPNVVLDRPWESLGIVLNHAFTLLLGASLLYAGGMIFNDIVDRRIDRAQRPTRPIPTGRISTRAASIAAAICGGLGLGCFALNANPGVMFFGVLLAAVIVAYDLLHKKTAVSIGLMGACRGLLVLTAAAAFPVSSGAAWLGRVGVAAGVMFMYVLAVTALARSEAKPGRAWAKRLIPYLLAGICLIDAALLLGLGHAAAAIVAAALFPVTILAQRMIPGT